MTDVVILGGGLSGLSAGYFSSFPVYEKSSHPGGHAYSDHSSGFIFDRGIHVLHTKNEIVLQLLDSIKVPTTVHERNAWIFTSSTYTRYPFQANTYGLPSSLIENCLYDFIENPSASRQLEHYEDWLRSIYGDSITDYFMKPYSHKFWGVPPSDLSLDWVNVRHPRPSLRDVIRGALTDSTKGFGVNANFRYPSSGGYGQISTSLASSLGDRLHLNYTCTSIDPTRKTITFNYTHTINYDQLLSTISLPALFSILPDVPSAVVSAVSQLRTNSICCVNLGFNRRDITDKHWIYFSEPDYSFVRVSFPSNYGFDVAPAGCTSISAEISYDSNRPLPPKERLIASVLSELKQARILVESDVPIFESVTHIPQAYVIFDHNRKSALKTIHSYLESLDIHFAGRYGMWAYLWSDEAIISGKRAIEKLISKNS